MSTNTAPRANPWLDDLEAYVPGKHGRRGEANIIRLSSNECAQGPSPKAVDAAKRLTGQMHRYADGAATGLREAIAEKHDLDPSRILCGTGSDEILQLCPLAFCAPGDEVIHTQYGFMVYALSARRAGAVPVSVPEVNFTADVDAILAAVTQKTRIVYLANPNNPTGTRLPTSEIERLHAGLPSDVLLVLDGAYAEYIEDPSYDAGLALAKSASNVLMTRTFSKLYGLAAERIGWGYGAPALIEPLNKIRAPFNVTGAGQAAAIASLGDDDWVAYVRSENVKWRSILMEGLTQLGLRPVPGDANFILTQCRSADEAARINAALMDRSIFVRHLPSMGLADCLRISVGNGDETSAILAALGDILKAAA
ncbi:MAG: histidinol-phosphate transaminase [Pseudomonadota bacterium]